MKSWIAFLILPVFSFFQGQINNLSKIPNRIPSRLPNPKHTQLPF